MRIALLSALLLVGACPAGDTAPPIEGLHIHGTLSYSQGVVRHSDGPEWSTNPVPYQVVALGPPALLTTVDSELQVATWVVTESSATYYADRLPWVAEPPVVALVGLPEKPAGGAEGLTLLRPDGSVGWQDARSDLLWPATGDPRSSIWTLTAGTGDSLILPFGSGPTLTRLDAATFNQLWESFLYTEAGVASAELYAVSEAGLLLGIQYDYEAWSLLVLDAQTGEERGRAPLNGQPAATVIYPGGAHEPTGVTLEDELASVTVYDQRVGGWQLWSLDLRTGDMTATGAQRPVMSRDETVHESSSAVPFPQRLLPTGAGENWSCPALVNSGGQILVIAAGQARWLDP